MKVTVENEGTKLSLKLEASELCAPIMDDPAFDAEEFGKRIEKAMRAVIENRQGEGKAIFKK